MKQKISLLISIMILPLLAFAGEYEVSRTDAHIFDANYMSLGSPRVKNSSSEHFFITKYSVKDNAETNKKINEFIFKNICEPLGYTGSSVSGWIRKDVSSKVQMSRYTSFLTVDDDGKVLEHAQGADLVASGVNCYR